jgi:hypothetical protein
MANEKEEGSPAHPVKAWWAGAPRAGRRELSSDRVSEPGAGAALSALTKQLI